MSLVRHSVTFYFRSNFKPQIWNPHGLFPIRIRNLVGLPPRLIGVLSEKRLLQCKIFRIWGPVGVGVTIFWRNPQKAHPCLISRVLSHYACESVHGFLLQAWPRKKGTLQKVTERLYFTYLRGISNSTKFNYTYVIIIVGVADIINHTKFGDGGPGSTKLRRVEFWLASSEWLVAYKTV